MSKIIPLKKKKSFCVLIVLTAAYMFFIWWHSTLSAEESTTESNFVLDFLSGILHTLGINAELTDYIVRKSAHFCEFALLGCLATWTFYLYNYKMFNNLMSIGFICLATAVIDELVQIGSLGRSAEVTDVALDFAGAVSGVFFFIIIISIIKLFKRR